MYVRHWLKEAPAAVRHRATDPLKEAPGAGATDQKKATRPLVTKLPKEAMRPEEPEQTPTQTPQPVSRTAGPGRYYPPRH